MTNNNNALFDLLEKPEQAALWAADEPAFLWRRAGRQIVWSNAAGIQLWQANNLSTLLHRRDVLQRQPAYNQIDRIAYRLNPQVAQLELLRFFAAGRDRNLLCRCEWRSLATDRLLLVRAAQPGGAPRAEPDLALHARLIADDLADDLAVFSSEGTLLAATKSMQAVLQHDEHELQADLASLARGVSSGEHTVRIDLAGQERHARAMELPCGSERLVLVRMLPMAERPVVSGITDLIERLQRAQLALPAAGANAAQGDTDVSDVAWSDSGGPDAHDTQSGATPAPENDNQVLVGEPEETKSNADVEDSMDAEAPAAPEPSPEPEPSHAQDVPQRQPASGGPNVFRLKTGAGATGEAPRLQSSEHAAFRELARALGARLEGDLEASAGSSQTGPDMNAIGSHTAEPDDSPTMPQPEPHELLTLLERVPIALLVFSDGRPVFANRAMLDMFRFAGTSQLLSLPGISGLLPQLATETGLYPARLVARRSDGEVFHVIARLRSISWRGKRAMLLSMREPEQEAIEQASAHTVSLSAARVALARPTEPAATTPHTRKEATRLEPTDHETALRMAADLVISIDATGHIKAAEGDTRALLARDETELVGKPFGSLFSETSRAQAEDYLDGLIQHGVERLLGESREVTLRRGDGRETIVRLKLAALGEGEERRYLAVMLNIAAWKQTEQELRTARKAAEAASTQKSEFLARVSHEIRTPLNSIIGFSEMMIEEGLTGVENERYRAYLHDIHDSGKLLLGVVNDLLDLSKVEAGKMELEFASVDVNELGRAALASMQPEASHGRIILRSSFAQDLPLVVADQRSLRQIMLNLLSNAIKFTEPGGQVILSTGRNSDGDVELRVRDTGIGMDKEQIVAALEPFRQIPRTVPTRTRGTGLGLPLTRALTEANRARFDIDSTPGIGTLVQITFPPPRVLGG